jgi:hypothetical protein
MPLRADMPNSPDLATVEAEVEKHRREVDTFFRKKWGARTRFQPIITAFEERLRNIESSSESGAQLASDVYTNGELLRIARDSNGAIQNYLVSIIELWATKKNAAIPAHYNVTWVRVRQEVRKHMYYSAQVLWSGSADKQSIAEYTVSFMKYYRDTTPRIQSLLYRDTCRLFDYAGVAGVHLLQQSIRKTHPDVTIWYIGMLETEAPPPTPPNGVKIAPGVVIEDQFREQHVYVLGLPRSGKSTLLRSMMLQDIERGSGACVIDPHGELIDDILPRIPKHREQDVILFSIDTLLPFNIFRATTEPQKAQLVGDIITLFERLKGVPGQRMDAILRHTVRTLVEIPGATFLDIHRLLTDKAYRAWAVDTANIPALHIYWNQVFPDYPGKDAAHPVLSRMSQFVLSADLEKILGRPSTLDFYDIIQSGKILLANISKGQFGEETTTLLGALLVSQLQLAGMRRANIPKPRRTPFFMYVDEFHNFKTSAFATILSEMPKYGLFLTMAHQYNYQLDEDTRRAVLGTVGNQVFFKLGPEDVKYVTPYIGDIDPKTPLRFTKGQAIYNSPNLEPRKIETSIYEPAGEKASLEAILENTMKVYGGASASIGIVTPQQDADPEPGDWPTT